MLTLFSALHENHFLLIKQTKIGYDLSSTIYLIKSREEFQQQGYHFVFEWEVTVPFIGWRKRSCPLEYPAWYNRLRVSRNLEVCVSRPRLILNRERVRKPCLIRNVFVEKNMICASRWPKNDPHQPALNRFCIKTVGIWGKIISSATIVLKNPPKDLLLLRKKGNRSKNI